MANMNVNVKEMGKQRGSLMGVGYRLIGWCKFVLLQKIFFRKNCPFYKYKLLLCLLRLCCLKIQKAQIAKNVHKFIVKGWE